MARTPKTAAKWAAISKGRFPTIAFVNKATTPLGVPLDKLVAALTRQLEEHFVPVWGYPAELYVTAEPKAGEWQIIFLDDADAANALGYHDLTKDGQPISKVFVNTTLAAGQKVSTTASHELLEMLIDPGATLWAQGGDGRFYAYEMCDAVEGEEYEIDDIAVSNFVYPSFFEAWRQPRSVPFDHLNKVSQPFETLQNGYQIINDGVSVREIFVSRAKERDFRTVEVRTQHRSEYRKMMAADGNAAQPPSPDMEDHAAVLYHAGQFLTALAVSKKRGPVSPFNWPWNLYPPGPPWRFP
ncbi:hypothetical protein [Bradyrhizobium sp. USDA 4454]